MQKKHEHPCKIPYLHAIIWSPNYPFLYFFRILVWIISQATHSNNSPEHRCSTSNFDHAENLYLRFKNAEASQSKLREDYSSLQTSYNELEKRLHDAECQALNAEELKVRLEELECENKRITDSDPGEIRKRLSNQEAEQKRLKGDMKTLGSVCATITSRLDKLTTENNQFRTKHHNLLKQNINQTNELEKLQSEIIKLKEDNRR